MRPRPTSIIYIMKAEKIAKELNIAISCMHQYTYPLRDLHQMQSWIFLLTFTYPLVTEIRKNNIVTKN